MDPATRAVAEDLLEALSESADASVKAMFGGYCVYLEGKVVALVCNGSIFVKRSQADHELEGWATLDTVYPGARLAWRRPDGVVRFLPDRGGLPYAACR
ncbi:TfoX/Sxy family protein [Tessaracoccus sp. OH4464_COT-324]|uniref:TfoX/Sxy family protein n=1 Tax=Tessaracoccus sp. OH4464_COT-324 TaxID=2491059 RepID=UPI000F63B52E|nr:hypothetical protein EII42_11995 [Tessaracoccus sp. OH4464_COT-324]